MALFILSILKVACPHCGKQVFTTQPFSTDGKGKKYPMTLHQVCADPNATAFLKTPVQTACFVCEKRFSVLFIE